MDLPVTIGNKPNWDRSVCLAWVDSSSAVSPFAVSSSLLGCKSAIPTMLHSSGHITGFRNAKDHFAAVTTSYCGLLDQLYDSLEVSHAQVLSISVADADH